MPSIKIYPPAQLPDKDISETQFNIWREELEVYLSQETIYAIFLPDGPYNNWLSAETNPLRVIELVEADQSTAQDRAARAAENNATLAKIQKDLRTVLSLVGKCVSQGHYTSVTRHSTSLQWIYDTLRADYDIQQKGIHFFNILDVKYSHENMTPIAFYNQYRTIVVNNLGKQNDTIKYKNDFVLTEDEKMTPMLEDIILLNVIHEIDPRLPAFIKTHYNHKMKQDDRLMDFKSDIMVNITNFLEQLDVNDQNSIKELPAFGAFKQGFNKPRNFKATRKPPNKKTLYCRLCFKSDLPREIYSSHNIGDPKCSEMSHQDRARLIQSLKMSNIKEEPACDDEDELAEMFGYCNNEETVTETEEEVTNVHDTLHSSSNFSRTTETRCSYICPVSSQILTVYQDSSNKLPLHLDLDSGATLNYCVESEVLKRGFKIHPNGQMSRLGDGVTKLKGIGEIHETFFRNNWKVQFSAIVCKTLTSPFIGGTPFLKQNGIDQDFVKNVIHVHNKQVTVQPTDPVALLPSAPLLCTAATPKVKPIKNVENSLIDLSPKVLLPGQSVDIPIKSEDGTIVSVEQWEHNNDQSWPEPHLSLITNGKLCIGNSTNNPILLGKDVKKVRIRSTHNPVTSENSYYEFIPSFNSISQDYVDQIKCENISEEAQAIIDKAHIKHSAVFNKDLTHGYNGFYGKHQCHLNWATTERPPASKVHVPSYDHDLKGLQQELMDDLTNQGVLLIPQDHGINVQSVCPSFIQRKQRAKDKSKQSLTKDDVRLLINFGPVNDKIKPVPTHVTKTNDVLIMMGRWKYIIIFDLFNGYFQNHMAKEAIPWLGVQTPYGGLRVIARSGQGLMGMAEEFDELLAKVLKQELQDGICAKIVDDVVVGGKTPVEAAINYVRVLSKLSNANLKITPEKTHIFPKTADMLGWVWKEGGHLEASPHRKFAILNTKSEDIKNVQDMRSWVGLFKTLHIVTPNISSILSPFELATAGKESKEYFQWTHQLESQFREAKKAIDKLVTLHLPSPDDQLVLETDASKGGGKTALPAGIGHILYAIKDNKKLPVRVHSAKLPDKCRKWSPCEIEALGFAVGIDKEYDIIRESKLPLIICPDSKPVHEAVKMINEGKFSSSARMSSFLTNCNRTRIVSKHVSGKAKLNPIADFQSRNPSECNAEFCSIHKFINEAVDSPVDEGAKNCRICHDDKHFSNREAWLNAQNSNQACVIAKQLLASGKPPPKAIGKNTGEYWNDVRQYCRDATIAKDGLLVVKSKPDVLSGNVVRERIVIPKPLIPALLYHIHNHDANHPVRSQQKSFFQRQFYAITLDKHLDLLYKNCYKCSVVIKLPKEIILNETKTDVNSPQTHFHADVIKRSSQNILTIRDRFSSYQEAMFVDSEKATDLKNGLIAITSSIRRPAEIYISVDNSPGFKTLLSNNDDELKSLKIKIMKTEELNKNANSVIDKGCQELEEEIKRLEPEGKKINLSTLKLAILNLNSKLRRRGNISAFEIHSSRDQNTGHNLNLDDETLRTNQLVKRKDQRTIDKVAVPVEVGDTVRLKNNHDKHKAGEIFLVTGEQDNNKVGLQKLLHPLATGKAKIMGKVYTSNSKHLTTIHKPEHPSQDLYDEDQFEVESVKINKPLSVWNPVNQLFFTESDDDSDDTQEPRPLVQQQPRHQVALSDEELQWDSSPEQIALQAHHDESSDNQELNNVLLPRQLFPNNSQSNPSSLSTVETSDEDVFYNDDFATPPTEPKLKRNERLRLNVKFPKQRNEPMSEPRITRNMLHSGRYTSLSAPTSPSEVRLNEVQNLDNVLQPRNPILPAAVELNQNVQFVGQALRNEETRRSNRIQSKGRTDYKKLHKYGRT